MSVGASAIRAGEAFVEIFARDKTDKGIKTTLQKFRSMSIAVAAIGASMTAASGAIFGGLGKTLSMFSDFGSNIADSIARTSLSPAFAQALAFQASQAGASLQDVEAAVGKSQKAIAQAAAGNKQAAKTFESLGLSAAQLAGLSPDQQFLAIAEALSRIDDPAKRTKLAMDVMGKGAMKLMGVLKEGSAGIIKNFEYLQRNGLILSDEDIDNADALGDSWALLTTTLGAAARLVGAALAPAMLVLLDYLQTAAVTVALFANNNRKLVVGLALVTAGIGALGLAFTAVGLAGILITGVIASWGAILGVLTGVWAALGGAIALIASPIGLVVLAIAGVGAAIGSALLLFFQLTDVGQRVWKDLAGGFGFFAGIAAQAFGSIFQALASGQWQKAGDVAMAGLTVAWKAGIGALVSTFTGFATWFVNGIASMLKKAIDMVAAFYADPTWKGFLNGFFAATGAGVAGKGVEHVATNAEAAKAAIDKLSGAASGWLGDLDTGAAADFAQALADFEAARKAATKGGKNAVPDWLKNMVGGGTMDGLATAQASSNFGSFSAGAASFQGIGKSSTFAPITEKLEEGNGLLQKIIDAIEADEEPEFGE